MATPIEDNSGSESASDSPPAVFAMDADACKIARNGAVAGTTEGEDSTDESAGFFDAVSYESADHGSAAAMITDKEAAAGISAENAAAAGISAENAAAAGIRTEITAAAGISAENAAAAGISAENAAAAGISAESAAAAGICAEIAAAAGTCVARNAAGEGTSATRLPRSSVANLPKWQKNVPPALAEKPAGLPPGKYTLVGWDMITTGRRLIDEICQIAAYAYPDYRYSQYIMPYRDLNPGARRRHKIYVVTVGRYRMLKDSLSHKIIKTKSEISALNDFLNWLEKIKSKDEKIILMYHEPRRLNPTVLIQSLNRYRLFDRFKTIVAGFTDSYALCADKCKGSFKSVSLRILTRLLLEEKVFHTDTALGRAIATYNIIDQLANQGGHLPDEAATLVTPSEEMMEVAREFARPVHTEVEALESLKDLIEKQNTFRLAFVPLLRAPRPNRRRLTHLRRALADAGLLYEQVKDAWHEGRRAGLQNLMTPLEQTLAPEDIEEVVELFNCHFCAKYDRPNITDEDETNLSSDADSSGPSSYSLAATYLGCDDDVEVDF